MKNHRNHKGYRVGRIGWAVAICLTLLLSPLANGIALAQEPDEPLDDAYEAAVQKWAEEFEISVLSEPERVAELRWFAEAAAPFRGYTIRSAAEDIRTHYWESEVLAEAFEEITGIRVEHEIIGEGSVVERLVEQQSTGRRIYDIYVNDADLVGTHLRSQAVVNLTDYMAGEGAEFTNPYLDLDDFLNLEFGQDYDGQQLQLPDQQFANLYWFRYDWFTDLRLRTAFSATYGYELGVPVNWAAYEDIAEFFTGREIDGQQVYGHLDYGKESPSLGWRFTDAWLSIAGVGDTGLPNGIPVDEWGIRVENRVPVGASIARGGAANSPAAIYALEKYLEWLDAYAPPEAREWRWVDAGPQAARGDIAQRIFQYVTWLSDDAFHEPGSPVVGANGDPLWRVAPTPHGRYWQEGMKVGYQDAGSWTIPANIRGQRRAMAWLWAQFCVSKSVSLQKFLVGGTPVRSSTVFADYLTERQAEWGGLIEFYRSEERKKWTDTGPNVPHYPELSAMWWPNIARAIAGQASPREAMDAIATEMDAAMATMRMARYSPQLNPMVGSSEWLSAPGSPKMIIVSEETPETIPYDELIQTWTQSE